jgi:hypothetical protein
VLVLGVLQHDLSLHACHVVQSRGGQNRLLTLLDTSAAVESAEGAAAQSGGSDGLPTDPEAALASAAAAANPERFILTIALCRVHEERPDPRRATATISQQRWDSISVLRIPAFLGAWSCFHPWPMPQRPCPITMYVCRRHCACNPRYSSGDVQDLWHPGFASLCLTPVKMALQAGFPTNDMLRICRSLCATG